jgi:copper chaperone
MKTKLTVKGMHCKSCEEILKDEFEENNVKVLKIDHKSGNLELEYNEKEISLEKIKQIIKDEDYKVE